MVRPKLRSRSLRRIYVRTPKGRVVIHYKKRKPQIAHCSNCGSPLKGYVRALSTVMKKMAKTKKRPERPHPNLCSRCMRRNIISEARKNV